MQLARLTIIPALLIAATVVSAQQKSEPLTQVALFRVDADKTGAFVEKGREFIPVMDKLMADGALLAYGMEVDLLHHTSEPNVAFWYTAANYTNLEKAEKAITEFQGKSPDLMKSLTALTDLNKHSDIIVRSLESGGASNSGCGTPVNSFSRFRLKPGKQKQFLEMFRANQKGVLDALVKGGAVCGYSFDVEDVHTIEPGTVWIIVSTPDLASWDKLDAAFEAEEAKLSAADKAIRENTWRDVQVDGTHRDSVSRVVFMKSK